MPKLPLRAAVSGCGGISPMTLDAAARSPDFEVVALQDPDRERLDLVGELYGVSRRHSDFESLLTADVDFVVLNGPNHVHLPQAWAAAAAGKHILVQKPMARNAAEAEAMVDAAREHEVCLGVTMFELGKPLHHEVKRMFRADWFGDPVMVQAVAAHDLYLDTPPEEGSWRRNAEQVGGGAFIQLSVHQVNLACWLLDREVESVFAVGSRAHTVFEDETTLAVSELTGGVPAQFAASYATDEWSFALFGTRGRIRLSADHVVMKGRRPWQGGILRYDSPGKEVAIPADDLRDAIAAREAAVEIHGMFARWIGGPGGFPCAGPAGLGDMRVVDAVYRSMAKGVAVRVRV